MRNVYRNDTGMKVRFVACEDLRGNNEVVEDDTT